MDNKDGMESSRGTVRRKGNAAWSGRRGVARASSGRRAGGGGCGGAVVGAPTTTPIGYTTPQQGARPAGAEKASRFLLFDLVGKDMIDRSRSTRGSIAS